MNVENKASKELSNKPRGTDLKSLVTMGEEKEETINAMSVLLDSTDINLKTELSDKEILEISKLEVLGDRINSGVLNDFLLKFKELRVSKNRQGRKEFIMANDDDGNKDGLMKTFFNDLMGK